MEDAKIYIFAALAVIAAISYAIVAVPVQAQVPASHQHQLQAPFALLHAQQPAGDDNNNHHGNNDDALGVTATPCHA